MRANLITINDEFISFQQFCQKSKLSQREIALIMEPLATALYQNKLKQRVVYLLVFVFLATLIYYISTTEVVSWHLSAIGRVALIKLLPIWNWQHLKYERCFVRDKVDFQIFLDCELCEINNYIDTEYDIKPTELDDHYIKLHKAVIVKNAITNWKIPDDFDTEWIPCKLSSNFLTGPADMGRILEKLSQFKNSYFVHFQNCDRQSVKFFRMFAPKPPVLPTRLSPNQYSWLLLSLDYNVSNYKKIELIEPIALIGQLAGYNYFQLKPRSNCEDYCQIIEVVLEEGEMLIVSDLYDLSYRPFPEGENVAIILEMHN
ncbi:hypothetical protein RI129_012652 [Pyrocoelia pectoralis]|uniref:Uncharacterized protein n=1 Tax=Pyrocoelia pectoralis TaxID=417401 RepID=A0AAN7ZC98_9COLE